MKINGKLILFTLMLVVLTIACKLLFGNNPDLSGFSPVIAIAVFSGFIIKQKDMSFLMPLLALLISDVVIQALYSMNLFEYPGFYQGQWKNYAFLLTATLIGWALKGKSYSSLVIGGIAAPTVFFLLSNFSVWLGVTDGTYAKDFNGLAACYAAGLPFYKNALIATLVFLPGMLVVYNYMMKQKVQLTVA